MQFLENEDQDGIRWSWNVLPSTRLEASRMAVPLGAMYTPMKPIANMNVSPHPPLICKSPACGTILNPYCRVDFLNKIWVCPFCTTRNHFPHSYADISTEKRPMEIDRRSTTMEYILSHEDKHAPIFLFVVDTCIPEEELQQLKTSITQSLMLLPENSLVGLITFGRNVHVHELSFEDCAKSIVVRGARTAITAQQVAQLLALSTTTMAGGAPAVPGVPAHPNSPSNMGVGVSPSASRFLMPVSECELQLTSILEDLTKDCWPCKNTERPQRCTGTAMAVALGLLEAACPKQSSRVMMFVGGPPTIGNGTVVGMEYKENIRSHHDIQKGNAPFFKNALKFYEGLATQAVQNGHVVDIFACSLDQVGLAEMKVCVEKTGGYLVLDDSFTRGVFTGSFKRIFARDQHDELAMSFQGELTVATSREWKVKGAIGSVTSAEKKSPSVSDQEQGIGQTCQWNLGGLDPNSTVALFFDVVKQDADNVQTDGQAYVQIVTRYRRSCGRVHLRVSTVAKTFANPKTPEGLHYIRAGFDQEAATVLMTRVASFKTNNEYTFNILRWLDSELIKLVAKFGIYKKDEPSSFDLTPEFKFYPQFMFYLRRSQFLQIFNSSPDETAFYRTILMNECVSNTMIMIQPTLTAYSLDGPAAPVMLDVSSCAPNRILVLDTFFHIVVWYGDAVAGWRAQKYHEKPEYSYIAELFRAPVNDVKALMEHRFPYPRYIECVERGSQSRFLMAKLNPSITQNTAQGQNGEPPVFTEDVSLNVFLQHLRRLAVSS